MSKYKIHSHEIGLGVSLRGMTPQLSVAFTIACSLYSSVGGLCVIQGVSGVDCTTRQYIDFQVETQKMHDSKGRLNLEIHVYGVDGVLGDELFTVLDRKLGDEFLLQKFGNKIRIEWFPFK